MRSSRRSSRPPRIKLIPGEFRTDQRGQVSFVNAFNFKGIKRFYQLKNSSLKIVRAFHGHLKEAKYIYVVTGKILLAAVYLDNPKQPSKNNNVHRIILSADKPTIAYIPPSYANGFKALEKNSTVIIFSTSTLAQSIKDDYRFPADYWGKDVWKIVWPNQY